MKLDIDGIPKFYMNLSRRPDRRVVAEEEFERHGLEVGRVIAANARFVRNARGFDSEVSYAIALTQRLALRRALLMGAEAVIVFEDDVALHPQLRERFAEIDLPDDWGIFYLGCRHLEAPEPVAPNLVRCMKTFDLHAFVVRADYLRTAIHAIRGTGTGIGCGEQSDRLLSRLGKTVPAYAAYPNLAWQRFSHSDHTGSQYTSYTPEGRQADYLHAITALEAKLRGSREGIPRLERAAQSGSADGVMEANRSNHSTPTRAVETDASVAVVTCHAGKPHAFEPWRNWVESVDLPAKCALYVVDGSGGGEIRERLMESVACLMRSGRWQSVTLVQGPSPSAEARGTMGRNAMVAEVYNAVLARVVEDYALIVEDDTVPPPDAIGRLLGTFESLSRKGNRVAMVSGCYESPSSRGFVCAARGKEQWTGIPRLGEIGECDPVEVGFAGIGCCLIETDALRSALPVRGDHDGPDFHLCKFLRAQGYTIWLDGGVQADHLIDPPALNPTNTTSRIAHFVAAIEQAGSGSTDVFGGTHTGGYLIQQHPGEFARLLSLLQPLPKIGLYGEIGTAAGGTTRFLFEHIGFGRGLLIDDGRHPEARHQSRNLEGLPVTRFTGDSHSREAAEFLDRELRGAKFDLVFIDGDHSAAGVEQDIALVRPHCTERTILVFHDIAMRQPPEFGVYEVWDKAERIVPVAEFVERLGIGVATLPQVPGPMRRNRRNIIYLVYPAADNDVWRENLQQLREHWQVFNGRRLVTVLQGPGLLDAEAVLGEIPDGAEVRIADNDSTLGEVPHFHRAIAELASLSPYEITFYAHTKGASRKSNPHEELCVRLWRNTMYARCLGDPDEIDRVLAEFACCGCFRRIGTYPQMPGVDWHFSGTFFWFNHARLFTRPGWELEMAGQQHGRYGVEGYLPRFFRCEEAACLAGDNAPNLYKVPIAYFEALAGRD